jgi:hypothetical protein
LRAAGCTSQHPRAQPLAASRTYTSVLRRSDGAYRRCPTPYTHTYKRLVFQARSKVHCRYVAASVSKILLTDHHTGVKQTGYNRWLRESLQGMQGYFAVQSKFREWPRPQKPCPMTMVSVGDWGADWDGDWDVEYNLTLVCVVLGAIRSTSQGGEGRQSTSAIPRRLCRSTFQQSQFCHRTTSPWLPLSHPPSTSFNARATQPPNRLQFGIRSSHGCHVSFTQAASDRVASCYTAD